VSIAEAQQVIVSEMGALADWMEKYEYLIGQGDALDSPDQELRRDENQLAGCQTQVWLRAGGDASRVRFRADSDARITRGLLALLMRVLDGRGADEIASARLDFIERTGLDRHLSPARGDGLAAIISEMREQAGNLVGQQD